MPESRPVTRRGVLAGGLAGAAAVLTGCADSSAPVWRDGRSAGAPGDAVGSGAGASGAPSAGPSGAASASPPPAAAGRPAYASTLTALLKKYLKPTKANPDHPTYAGAVALVMVGGKVTANVAVGHAVRYGPGPVELPAARRVAMRPDSIFDLASLTKVYTAVLLLQQVDRGKIDLDAPVVRYLPGFTGAGKDKVTVRMLLTHTSGLKVGASVAGLGSMAAKNRSVLATPLVRGETPGRTYRYSSVGLMVAAMLVEQATGRRFDAALKAGLTGPMGLRETGFNPLGWLSAAAKANRLVATDARTSRGLLRGVVHDDVTNHMGGVAGSAGIFAPAAEVAAVGQMLLDGGVYRGRRVLSAGIVRQMLTNHNAGLPAVDPDRPGRPSDHGLGVTLRQPWFMGRLTTPKTFGHTGFTGTSLLVDPGRRLVFVLLTNRAHPNWSWANPDPMRAAAANVLADARTL